MMISVSLVDSMNSLTENENNRQIDAVYPYEQFTYITVGELMEVATNVGFIN